MTLADPGRAEQQQVVAALNVAAGSKFADLLGIDRGLELEVETLERLLEGKPRHRNPHLMMLVGLRIDLSGQQLIEEVGVGHFLLRRLLQARGKLLLNLIEAQTLAVFAQAVELRSTHRTSPPSPWPTIS